MTKDTTNDYNNLDARGMIQMVYDNIKHVDNIDKTLIRADDLAYTLDEAYDTALMNNEYQQLDTISVLLQVTNVIQERLTEADYTPAKGELVTLNTLLDKLSELHYNGCDLVNNPDVYMEA